MRNYAGETIDVLLVEPHSEDAYRFTESLESEKIANRVHVVSSGAEALEFLHQRGEHSDAPRPDFILLEFDLPEMSGKDVLEDLNGHDELASVPVVVLTGSDDAEHVAQSYDLHANAYVQKPVNPDEFIEVARSIEDFWIQIVRLPSTNEE